jgi:hypothetical protein
MAQPSPSPLPPAGAEYETTMHTVPGKLPPVHKWKMFRSSQGETHLDFGKTGLISKPGAKQSILLDHVKQEARIVPVPAHAQAPVPSSPQAPSASVPHLPVPPAALLHVKDLGKQMIGGHEAEGKLYTFQPPKVPAAPAIKGLPGLKGPKLAALPGALPKAPGLPQPPTPAAPHGHVQTLEVWTHAQLKVPLLTKAIGMPGLQSSVCKNAKSGEPPASLFHIPPGYKLIEPKPPALPHPRL